MSQYPSIWEMPEHERRVAIVRRQVRAARKALGHKHDMLVIEPTPTPIPAGLEPRPLPDDMPTWKRILYETSRSHRVSISEISGPQRSKAIVAARHECMYRMKTETLLSLPQIAQRLNRADHSTVLHGIAKHRARMAMKAGESQTKRELSPLST